MAQRRTALMGEEGAVIGKHELLGGYDHLSLSRYDMNNSQLINTAEKLSFFLSY